MGDPIDKSEWQKSKNNKNITNSNSSSCIIGLTGSEKKHKEILALEWDAMKGGDQLQGSDPATNQPTNHNRAPNLYKPYSGY